MLKKSAPTDKKVNYMTELIPVSSPPIRATILIALSDEELGYEITQQLKYFNYACQTCSDLTHLNEKAQQLTGPGAILVDAAYCTPVQLPILKGIGNRLPLIFISKISTLALRLDAVLAGGQAYFVPPFEFTALLETLDALTTPLEENAPYRILIIEDSKTQAGIIRKHLTQAGLTTEILMEPVKLTETLEEFQPDLILLDLYLPSYSGADIAKVIRQQEQFVSIPIVYFSSEEDIHKQLTAIEGGGDDFLTKPITPEHLVAAVKARAKRSRTLRAEMILDSLTGLLNHTRILEQLSLEIARAKRHTTSLCFSMIDIDHFKKINDQFGHPAGDQVIKSLARLLKQHLRKTDSIGRYGGEEFAIIFPHSTSDSIAEKLEHLREAFSQLLHRSGHTSTEFSVTFSAGIAQLSLEVNTLDKLVQAADKALYIAKGEGRNKIVRFN